MTDLPISPLTQSALNGAALVIIRNHPEIDTYSDNEWTSALMLGLANVSRAVVSVRRDPDARTELVRRLVELAADCCLWAEALEGGGIMPGRLGDLREAPPRLTGDLRAPVINPPIGAGVSDVRLFAVHPALWPDLVRWLAARGLIIGEVPDSDPPAWVASPADMAPGEGGEPA